MVSELPNEEIKAGPKINNEPRDALSNTGSYKTLASYAYQSLSTKTKTAIKNK